MQLHVSSKEKADVEKEVKEVAHERDKWKTFQLIRITKDIYVLQIHSYKLCNY